MEKEGLKVCAASTFQAFKIVRFERRQYATLLVTKYVHDESVFTQLDGGVLYAIAVKTVSETQDA